MNKHMLMLLAAAAMIISYSCTKPDDDTSGNGEGTEQEGNKNEEDEGGSKEPTTYKAGDYYQSGLAKGVVVYTDESGEHGLVISLDQTRAAWSTENQLLTLQGGEFSPTDGAANTNHVKSLDQWQDKYPAFRWCDSKNALGLSSWFLPSYGELEYVNNSLDEINATLTELGMETISTEANACYWSSYELGPTAAQAFSFFYGEIAPYDNAKSNEHLVRAMRKF